MSYGKRLQFYHSQAWKNARESYLAFRKAIDGGICEICHDQLGDTIHHIEHLNDINVDNPDIALGFNNLCLICRDCHAKAHTSVKGANSRYRYDDEGNIISAENAPPPIKSIF